MTTPNQASIQNFRNAAGIGNIFRCASPDVLGEKLIIYGDNGNLEEHIDGHDRFVLDQAHLVLDLRSPTERNEVQSKVWMNHAGMRIFENDEDYQLTGRRSVVRIDVLSPPRFMNYIEENWFSYGERAQAGWYKLVDGSKLHDLRIERLNEYGLAGLNEAILETGKEELCRALKTITAHLEQNPGQSAVIHCVQGKDRTGMLVMLLQSLLGVSDLAIIADYFMSNRMLQDGGGSAAVDQVRTRGKLDRRFFSGTNEQAMISTLHFLRRKYGSVSPGYLDAIGFDRTWRNRLMAVLVPDQGSRSSRL
jgi:Tyrosine phosphatase family